MCSILQGTSFLHYLLAKLSAVNCFSSEISPGQHKERCSCWPGSSAFSSGELSGTRKQLSAGPVPFTACKGRRWLCRKRAGTGFLLPEEGRNLHQWDVLHALAGNTAALESAVPASSSLAEIKASICLCCGQRAGGLCHQSAHIPVPSCQQGGLYLCSRVQVLCARGRIQTYAGGQRFPKP